MSELPPEFYQDQYRKLLDHNQELQVEIDRLSKLVDEEAQKQIAELEAANDTVLRLLGLVNIELAARRSERDRIIQILINDIYEVVTGGDDDD